MRLGHSDEWLLLFLVEKKVGFDRPETRIEKPAVSNRSCRMRVKRVILVGRRLPPVLPYERTSPAWPHMPDNGMDRLLPPGGIVCKDYTTAPGEASAGSARLPPPGAGVY